MKNSHCARYSEGLRDTGGQTRISLKLVGILSITLTWLVFYPVSYENSALSTWRPGEEQTFLETITVRSQSLWFLWWINRGVWGCVYIYMNVHSQLGMPYTKVQQLRLWILESKHIIKLQYLYLKPIVINYKLSLTGNAPLWVLWMHSGWIRMRCWFLWISALTSTGLQFWHCLPLLQSSFLFQHLFMDRSLLLLLLWYIYCCFTTIHCLFVCCACLFSATATLFLLMSAGPNPYQHVARPLPQAFDLS